MLLNTVSVTDLDQALHNLRDLATEMSPEVDEPDTAQLRAVLAQVSEVYLVGEQRMATPAERESVRGVLQARLTAGPSAG